MENTSTSSSSGQRPFRLLALPAEIRNEIYKDFLVPRGHIELTTYPLSIPRTLGVGIANSHDVHPAALLRCCRQVRHEATAILYKQNHFKILIPQGDRSEVAVWHHLDQIGIWLHSLGSCLPLLRRISITVPRAIESMNDENSFMPDNPSITFLNICKAFWSSSRPLTMALDIVDCGVHTDPWDSNIDLRCVNNVLQALIHDRDLGETDPTNAQLNVGVKHLRRMMVDIRMYVDCSQGCIFWRGSDSQGSYLRQRFRTWFQQTEGGRMLKHTPQGEIPFVVDFGLRVSHWNTSSIHSAALSPNLQDYLWTTILVPGPDAVLDLNSRTWTGPSPKLLGICRAIRNVRSYQYWSENNFEVRMIGSGPWYKLSDFGGLKFWPDTRESREYRDTTTHPNHVVISRKWPWYCGEVGKVKKLKIRVHFELQHFYERDQIRVGIMDIIRVTSHMKGQQVELRITWGLTPDENTPRYDTGDETIITLEHLRQRALIALSNVCLSEPKYFARPCPQIWMNHVGEIVEVSHGKTSLPAALPPASPSSPKLGDNSWRFMKDYVSSYKFEPDPYNSLQMVEDDYRMRDEDPDLSRFPEVTRYSDGSLICHIRYLMSVLWYVDDADLWGKICKFNLPTRTCTR